MRHFIVVLAIMLASGAYSTTAMSEDNTPRVPGEYGQYKDFEFKGQKDECLIMAKNCIVDSETAMQRIERLQKEIDKGAAVYTPEELKNFQNQLNWIYSESGTFSGGSY